MNYKITRTKQLMLGISGASIKNERGATLTEYGLLVSLVALACVFSMKVLSQRIGDCGVLGKSSAAVSNAGSSQKQIILANGILSKKCASVQPTSEETAPTEVN